MNRIRLSFVAGVGTAGVLGLLYLAMRPAEPPVHRFVEGITDRYHVVWDTHAVAKLPIGDVEPFDVRSRLEGTWTVTTATGTPAGVVQRAWLTGIVDLEVSVGEERAPIDASSLERVVVELHRAPSGELVDVRLPPEAPVAARNTLVGLAKEFAVPAPGTETRRTPYGVALDHWEGDRRRVQAFSRLAGAPADATLTARGEGRMRLVDGRLEVLETHDEAEAMQAGVPVLAIEDHFVLRREAGKPPPVDLQVPVVSSNALAGRAPSPRWSGSRVMGVLTTFEAGDDSAELMWNGTARVAGDASLRGRVAALAAAPGTPHPRRELALDLLAHAPGGAGEASLLQALRRLEDEPAFPSYLQRLGFLEAPSPEVERALRAWSDHADPLVARAARVTLGATGLGLDLLRGPLSPDPEDAASQLAGLGNAHQTGDQDTLVAATSHDDARVRAAALHALRHYGGDEIRTAMVLGASDTHPGVQRAALSQLDRRDLADGDVVALAGLVGEGGLAAENLGLMATVLMRYTAEPAARDALRAMLDHPAGSPELRARLRSLLED